MNRVIHFEIHASDPERTAAFYRAVFDWDIVERRIPGVELPPEHRYWLVTTGADAERGINGGILVRRGPAPAGSSARRNRNPPPPLPLPGES